jgi:hypothetical protein
VCTCTRIRHKSLLVTTRCVDWVRECHSGVVFQIGPTGDVEAYHKTQPSAATPSASRGPYLLYVEDACQRLLQLVC